MDRLADSLKKQVYLLNISPATVNVPPGTVTVESKTARA
jgi:hypothetical protein